MSSIVRNFDPSISAAKGKGCNTGIMFAAPEREVKVFMGGIGVASPSRSAATQPANLAELDSKPLASMEWLSNQMFGQHQELGEINARFKVLPEGKNRSTATVLPQQEGALLPARIVNSLYLDINIPALNLKMENRDALVLSSNSVAMTAEVLLRDLRLRLRPSGIPAYERQLLAGQAPTRFLAAGTHRQIDPVQLFQNQDPFVAIARLQNAEVMVLPHYGLEVELSSGDINADGWSATLTIHNLTDQALDLRWFCDSLNRLRLSGRRNGRLNLPAQGQKTVNLKGTIVGDVDATDGLDTVMFSICNVALGPDEFVSGYIALRVGS